MRIPGHQRRSDPDEVGHRAGVFVEHRFDTEQARVPRLAGFQVVDRDGVSAADGVVVDENLITSDPVQRIRRRSPRELRRGRQVAENSSTGLSGPGDDRGRGYLRLIRLARRRGQVFGGMFWLSRKRLVGS